MMIETQTDISHKKTKQYCNTMQSFECPPLAMFRQASASLDDSFVTETESEETDLDAPFCSKQEDYNTE